MKNRSSAKNAGVLKRVLKYIAAERLYLAVSILCAAVSVILALYQPILIGKAVDSVLGKGNVDFARLGAILTRMGIMIAAAAFAQLVMNRCNNRISFGVVKRMRQDVFTHIQSLPFSFIDSRPYGELVSRIITDTDAFSDGLLLGFSQLFTGLLTILGTLVFMFSIHVLTAFAVVVLTPVSLLVASFIARRTYAMFRRQSETRGQLTAFIDEMIAGQKVVSAFGHEEQAVTDFDVINERLKGYSLRATFYSSLTNPCTRFVNSLVYAAVGILGAVMAIRGAISIGQLVSFLSYANQYTKPFNEISEVMTEFQNALACAARVFELMDEPAETADRADAAVLDSPDGNVELKDVSFSYLPERPLIENLNLQVRSGQRIAIVGPTGCGKTTIINLLMRFYDVTAGEVDVSGRDIRTVTRESLRSCYGMVLQETWIRSGTIRENILLARPDASEEEMIEAAKRSHAHSFIRRLPQGYDTYISEETGSLSQGQRQLLCITRVMLALPPMLILDEATSSIDVRTEQRIQKAFAALMDGRTSFIVAHRLSTIQNADVILVMKNGSVIEQGNHEGLMKQDGFYAQLYRSQFAQ